jgi:hypothetical protein
METESSYESEQYPMLPKEVIHRAVNSGFPFFGSLGPENVLDIRFFRALAVDWQMRHQEKPTDAEVEAKTRDLAHSTFDFYLHFFELPKEEAQKAAAKFWEELLKP